LNIWFAEANLALEKKIIENFLEQIWNALAEYTSGCDHCPISVAIL
jgi:hypothetical protein